MAYSRLRSQHERVVRFVDLGLGFGVHAVAPLRPRANSQPTGSDRQGVIGKEGIGLSQPVSQVWWLLGGVRTAIPTSETPAPRL